jgi:hypothetical protein
MRIAGVGKVIFNEFDECIMWFNLPTIKTLQILYQNDGLGAG